MATNTCTMYKKSLFVSSKTWQWHLNTLNKRNLFYAVFICEIMPWLKWNKHPLSSWLLISFSISIEIKNQFLCVRKTSLCECYAMEWLMNSFCCRLCFLWWQIFPVFYTFNEKDIWFREVPLFFKMESTKLNKMRWISYYRQEQCPCKRMKKLLTSRFAEEIGVPFHYSKPVPEFDWYLPNNVN